jgi:hypothetical protein
MQDGVFTTDDTKQNSNQYFMQAYEHENIFQKYKWSVL